MEKTFTRLLAHCWYNGSLRKSLCVVGLLLISFMSYGQTKKVTGSVKDETGAPLPGVNVVEQGTSNGSTTDADGEFSVETSPDATLVFTFIGYAPKAVVVGSQTVINIQMEIDVLALAEVVVVGYGTQKKSDLTGAVSIADPVEMKKQASSDLTQMLQGRVAGVSITSDGQAGASPNVRIRGISTINAGAEPLYVVDGFPLSGGIRDINPNDIESIQILKDASAGAIYGNRAANGVVIITTKKGAKGEPLSVSFNTYYGFQKVKQRLPLLNREGYQMMNNEVLSNAGAPLVPGNDAASPSYITDVDTDWQDEGYKDGSIVNYNLGLSGGSEKTTYFVSLDYLDNIGTLVGTGPDYKRYSLRANTEAKLGKLKIGENLQLMRSEEHPLFFTTSISLPGGRPSLVNDLVQAAPTVPVYDENREGGYGGADAVIHQSITLNVPGFNSLIRNNTLVNRTIANIYGELEVVKGLTLKTNLGYDNSAIEDQLFVPEYDLGYFFPNPDARLWVGTRNSSSFLIENTATYAKKFGKHDLTVLAGQTFQKFDFRQVVAVGTGLEKPYVISLASAASFSVTDNQQPAAMESLLGRINYSYDDKYLLTFNIRRDGSSKFSSENRYDIFPSVSAAWKIHNQFTLPSIISELKLRGGIGEVGNQDIPNFLNLAKINRAIPYQYSTGERVLGAAATVLVDPAISWETRVTRNVGVDAVLLDGRLEFTAEYYSNESRDLLFNLPMPATTGSLPPPGSGTPSVWTNVGSVKNSGIELSASYTQNFGEDLSITVAPNFYTVKNKVTDMGPLESLAGAGSRTEVGRSIGEHYGWVYDGIFQDASEINVVNPEDAAFDETKHAFQSANTAAGDIRFKDLNDDGIIDEDDRTFLGTAIPKYYYGLNITAGYKGFDFTFFLSGSGGNLINSNLYRGLMGTSSFTNWHEDILNRWTPENTNTDIPRVVWNDPNNNNRDSNRPGWLQKGDYMRINTIALGYKLPTKLISKVRLTSARVYASVQNLKTFTSYKGYNPDFQSAIINSGFDYGTYPRPTTTMLGLQLKF
jgi:TonB-dependent starch-binding outer membrane protein SusC